MHTLSVAENIIKIVNDKTKEDNNKVLNINLKIGKLTCVTPVGLEFMFKALTKGTNLENTNLKIEEVPIRIYCNNCKYEYEINDYIFLCHKCESSNTKIVTGKELFIESIEIE